MFRKTRVAVLSGGPSSEYDVSLKTGRTMLDNLPEEYIGHDIFIDKAGNWHLKVSAASQRYFKKSRCRLQCASRQFGEDGSYKNLDSFGVPYTGSGALGSAIGMNKVLTKRLCKTHGIKTAHHTVLKQHERRMQKWLSFKTFPMPAIVKPVASGSSVGTRWRGHFPNCLARSSTLLNTDRRRLSKNILSAKKRRVV